MPRETTRALVGAALCLAGLLALGLIVYSPAGIVLDEHSMRACTRLYKPTAEPWATAFVNLGGPAMAVLTCLGLAATALVRGRPRLAALALIVPAGAALCTGVLKHTLAQSRVCMCLADDRVGSGAWPSGHATMATALVLAAVIVAAPRWRSRVALVGGGALAAFYGALLVMGWHYPSDVLGGLLAPGCARRDRCARLRRAAQPVARTARGRARPAGRARAGRRLHRRHVLRRRRRALAPARCRGLRALLRLAACSGGRRHRRVRRR